MSSILVSFMSSFDDGKDTCELNIELFLYTWGDSLAKTTNKRKFHDCTAEKNSQTEFYQTCRSIQNPVGR
jgi:hypothetical protein